MKLPVIKFDILNRNNVCYTKDSLVFDESKVFEIFSQYELSSKLIGTCNLSKELDGVYAVNVEITDAEFKSIIEQQGCLSLFSHAGLIEMDFGSEVINAEPKYLYMIMKENWSYYGM